MTEASACIYLGKPRGAGKIPWIPGMPQNPSILTGDFSDLKEYLGKCHDPKVVQVVQDHINKYAHGNYDLAISYSGTAAPAAGWGNGGATQWQLMERVDLLEKLGMVKEYKVPPTIANPQIFIPDGKGYNSGQNIIDSIGK